MARIVVIQHETERLSCSKYALQLLIDRWEEAGHKVLLASGTRDLPDGDLAFLHVNLSVVPNSYAQAARRYRRSVNAYGLDIRKRVVSRNILGPDDPWNGPVILKTDLNCMGYPEFAARFHALGRIPTPREAGAALFRYSIFANSSEVPKSAWTDPRVVIERFLPEQDDEGYYLRTWIFLGERERCRRFRSDNPLIKGRDYVNFSPADVPDFLRLERERLGLDYGKFDFVIHNGEVVLLDANKTMGIPPNERPELQSAYSELADGISAFLTPARS